MKTIEEVIAYLEAEMKALAKSYASEVHDDQQNGLSGQYYMCKRLLNRLEASHSDEEEG